MEIPNTSVIEMSELDPLVCPQCHRAFQTCPSRQPMKLRAQGCEHSICKDCSESPPPKCPVAKCNRGVYPDDPVFIVDKALMVAVTERLARERLAQSASATLASVSPKCAL